MVLVDVREGRRRGGEASSGGKGARQSQTASRGRRETNNFHFPELLPAGRGADVSLTQAHLGGDDCQREEEEEDDERG